MKEREIDALAAGSREALEESVRVRWRAVSCAPQDQSVLQLYRLQPIT